MKTKKESKKTEKTPCKHPAARIYSWFVTDCATGKRVLCAGCCDCGKVLAGGAE